MDYSTMPTWDLSSYLAGAEGAAEVCKGMAECLHETGILVIRDPRVTFEANATFIDTMEKYFEQPEEVKAADARPELSYQLGVTPEGVEIYRCAKELDECKAKVEAMPVEDRPHLPSGPDLKCRYFWRMGELPPTTAFPTLNSPPVIPAAFPEWSTVMDTWGGLMLQAVTTVAECVALGLSLDKEFFTARMKYGPHLLAPTGSNLARHNGKGDIFAGYHSDLNFMTIHGRSRFPGLFVWLRNGKKVAVKVPEGCLLVQAAKQLEYATGGYIMAGMHEVVVTDDTLAAVEAARAAGRSLWRVSSTLFSHLASDQVLKPFPPFDTEAAKAAFPETLVGNQVQKELEFINLAKATTGETFIAAM